MEQSLIAAVSGIDANQSYLDVIGNNVANSNTTGYKAQETDFTDLLAQQIAGATTPSAGNSAGLNPVSIGSGVRVGAITTDETQGALLETDQPTDLAIQGNGYFVATQNGQTLYTRAGSLSLDANGNLATSTGGLVQGWMGPTSTGATTPITIQLGQTNPAGASLDSYTIGADGVITGTYSDGTSARLGQVALATFTNPAGLDDQGNMMYTPTANSGAPAVGQPGANGAGSLVQGYLEGSNVNLDNELTNLIVAQEAYQANTKVVSTTSTVLTSLMQMG